MNRVKYALPAVAPKVSIVICTRDRADLLASCVDSIIERSTYRNYEVLIVDNGSTEEATFRLFNRLPSERFRILRDESAFNFSALNNRAVQAADGEYICLLNNDIEVLTARLDRRDAVVCDPARRRCSRRALVVSGWRLAARRRHSRV